MGQMFTAPLPDGSVVIERITQSNAERIYPWIKEERHAREDTLVVLLRERGKKLYSRDYAQALRKLRAEKQRAPEREQMWKRINAVKEQTIMTYRIEEVIKGTKLGAMTNDDEDAVMYLAYAFADDQNRYLDIMLNFEVKRERRGKGRNVEERMVISLGYLVRCLAGQKWCLIKQPQEVCHIMYASQFVKQVLKWAKQQHGVSVVEFQPMTQESVNMWKRLALRGDEDEPFATLTTAPGLRQERQQADMDLFNLQVRICAECNWFATYTLDHPTLKNQLYFCGESCARQTWSKGL